MSLIIQNISKNFNGLQVLEDISLSVNTGEIISILGPSGCGKSTLLQLVAGLQLPSSGEIILHNELLSSSKFLLPPERRPINMVFQDYALWPHMTIEQNVVYGLKLKKVKKNIIEEKKHKLFELLSLRGLENRFPVQLSGGQQQRVAIARALATEPKLLLMDEPLSNLDMQLRYEMRNELSYLLRQLGTTVLHVTHDPLEAYALADRILILREGSIEQLGTPKQVCEQPASLWVAGLLGMTNRLQGIAVNEQLSDGQAVLIGETLITGRGEVKEGKEAVVMINSEDIKVLEQTSAALNDNCLQGKVIHAVYEGKKWRIIIHTAGGRVTALHEKELPTDTTVHLEFPLKDTLVFAKKDERKLELAGQSK
ncbi:ABC transporter ATP-binding protein [Metabacillus fastidiosus]|uniref:ABC transporter ATP-binding protein n=1 Tax=Metabacillus fastidiosus TaxID=1458 RepID=UPI003D26FC92